MLTTTVNVNIYPYIILLSTRRYLTYGKKKKKKDFWKQNYLQVLSLETFAPNPWFLAISIKAKQINAEKIMLIGLDHRIIQVGEDLRKSLPQPPAQGRVSYEVRSDCSRLYAIGS